MGTTQYGVGGAPPAINTSQVYSLKSHTIINDMRKLWEDHVFWTRLWIVDYANSNGNVTSDATRLLQNQVDIGNAIKSYYGTTSGDKLTILLKDHINLAVEIVKAAKINDVNALNSANAKWYDNANQIADFLSNANPNLTNAEMRDMMKTHLDLTKQEAVDILNKKYTESVTDFDSIQNEILSMSDTLSQGVIQQFPGKFQ